jgi:two-component system, LuxR family, sensor kinase FixL
LLIVYLLFFYKKQKLQGITILNQENRYKRLVDFNRLSEMSELTASLSHQLNQPLTAILSSSQASLRFINNDKFEKELFIEIITNIVEDVKRASEIIKSLRSMMKKENIEKKRVNVNKIAADVFLLVNSQASINDIIFESQFDDKDPFIYADSLLIQQVILNLLRNAAGELENITKNNKKILLRTKVQNDIVNVSVTDNGPGILDIYNKSIFKPFFTTKSDGLGIGLAICKSIIEEHEGEIKFENNQSAGVTFSFKLKTVR